MMSRRYIAVFTFAALLVNLLLPFTFSYSGDGPSLYGKQLVLCSPDNAQTIDSAQLDEHQNPPTSPFSCGLCLLLAQGFMSLDLPAIVRTSPVKQLTQTSTRSREQDIALYDRGGYSPAAPRAPPVICL